MAQGELPEFRPPGPGVRLDPEEQVEASPAVADGSAPVLRVRVTGTGWQFLAGRPGAGPAPVRVPRRVVYEREPGLAVLEEFLHVGYGAVREGPTEMWGLGPLVLQDAPEEAGGAGGAGGASASGPARRARRRWWPWRRGVTRIG